MVYIASIVCMARSCVRFHTSYGYMLYTAEGCIQPRHRIWSPLCIRPIAHMLHVAVCCVWPPAAYDPMLRRASTLHLATHSRMLHPARVRTTVPIPTLPTPRSHPCAPLYCSHPVQGTQVPVCIVVLSPPRASTCGCPQKSCSRHSGESSPRAKIFCKTPEQRGFHPSCAVRVLAPASAALWETFTWYFLHEHPALPPDFDISPCWLLSPSHAGSFLPPCRRLASSGRLFPGREHGRQHLRQLRQRQPRALCEV